MNIRPPEKPSERQKTTPPGKTAPHLGRLLAAGLRKAMSRQGPVTWEGIVFALLAFLIGLAATNTGLNLLYLIFSLMVAFFLTSGFLSSRSLKKIKVRRTLPKHIVAGEPVDVRFVIRNEKRFFAAYALQVCDRMEDGSPAGYCYVMHIRPKSEVRISYPCTFNRRGLYRFGDVVISTTYPFGFVRRSVVLRAPLEVLVYPQILPLERLGLESPPDFGEKESRRKGHGSSLYGIREQQPGEAARWIHWKKTAQTGRLMRREFETEEKKNVRILLDNALPDPDDPDARESFERAVVLTASVAHHLLRSDHQVELATRSGRIPYNSGPHQRYRILRALALIEPVAGADAPPMRATISADTATILFCCEGAGSPERYPQGTQVYVVSSRGARGLRQEKPTAETVEAVRR